jgi:hypothetical protein
VSGAEARAGRRERGTGSAVGRDSGTEHQSI